ncbi:S1 RNA-binding domain-containing protein [Ktedonosporobacter rubrisoli]|uniref:S1 RNA-binding domain-containing protein n=1 Tax=Ktedonosporobacter rubrisoli TaxID=2509675 RepID=A0A4P6JYB7_KTERU|nr:S1 RNA-binding domain-containing protein [Ktedonosporobacter rubrisoli]QBD80717.1 S1 RNA-binding domain-containing protein [Ktedonosporobacter rubrisoli]
MSEKQTEQHSQHFNLSGEAKQKLEQLTARRYPGKKRRQSQLVEDLITQAFAKEYAMSPSATTMQEPDPDWLAPATKEAISLARQAALRFKATTVTPEHLLLGLVEQSEKGLLDALASWHIEVSTMHRYLDRLLTAEQQRQTVEGQSSIQRRLEELFAELKPGEVRRGIVSQITNFGAYVDLGAYGSLRLNHPSEVLYAGQEVEVQIISVDKEKKKISLSLKRAGVDPWTTVAQRYAPGQIVKGVITKIAPFGAFARIEDGVEGLVHLSEITPGVDPKTILQEGAQLQFRILHIDAERHRLSLSLFLVEEAERNDTASEPGVQQIASVVPDVEAFDDSLPLSDEAQESLRQALTIAKRMHSSLVQPEHLLLGIFQNRRIQDALAPLLPSSATFSAPRADTPQRASKQGATCPRCKRMLQAHWKHCVYCGQSLASVCPQCGAPRAEVEDVRFCYECGSPLE